MLRGGLLAALLIAAPVLTGCIGAGDGDDLATQSTPADLQGHPFPDGDEGWPIDLTGPFELGETLTDPIGSFDGTPLETTTYIPELPEGVKAPVVLWSQPYTGGCAANVITSGSCMAASDSETIYEGGYSRLDPSVLVENGFAVAISNVRGTGNSGGCFGFGSLDEQMDQVHLVEHLAEQEWSNGHVAMYGHSYHGFTPWMAAIQAPSALKTVIASGLMTDIYTFTHSPQGAASAAVVGFNAGYSASLNFIPPLGGDAEHATAEHAPHYPDRLCPDVAQVMTESAQGAATDTRDAAFWDERRLITGFPNITSSVLVATGFWDTAFEAGHSFQDDDVWHSLPEETPKRMIAGQWGHDLPPPAEQIENAPFGGDWYEDTAIPWLTYWLKGVGDPGDLHLGTAHYQDSTDAWHETSAWPPTEVRHEVFYLAGDGTLAPEPSEGSRSFLSAGAKICQDLPEDPRVLYYVTEPLEEPITLAGNPWAYLQVESTEPGGVVAVHLGTPREDPDPACRQDLELFSKGAADLRFHQGNYVGQDFPVMDPSPVRVDLYNQAWTIPAGERLYLMVSPGWAGGAHASQPYTPLVTLHGGTDAEASHIVLPLVEGTLGGDVPSLDYPPQPFLPPAAAGGR